MLAGLKELKISLLCFIIFSFMFFKYITNLKFDKSWVFFSKKPQSFVIKAFECWGGGV